MTAPIRPGLTPQLQPAPGATKSPAALAAQRAFFQAALQQAALQQAGAPQAAQPTAPAAPPVRAASTSPTPSTSDTAPLPRLGLHLDIRV